MVRVKSPQDIGAGVVFMLIGIAGLYFGSELAFGTAARMGPGYFPTLLSMLIIAVGVVVAFRGMTIPGPPVETIQLRPIVFRHRSHPDLRGDDRGDRARAYGHPADHLRRLCTSRGETGRNDAARRRPRVVHRCRVRLCARAGATRVVGPVDGIRPVPESRDRLRGGAFVQESRLCPARLSARHADRSAPRHRPDSHHRHAAADNLRSRALVRADHAGRHLLRRAVRRLDHVDPGEHPGRGGLDRHLPRRQPDGQAGTRRRRARSGRPGLVLRRLRRHDLHRGVRSAACRHRPGVQLAGLFFADGARARHCGGAGARIGDQGGRNGSCRPAVRSRRHRRQQRIDALYVRRFRVVGRHRLPSAGHWNVRHRRDHPQSGAARRCRARNSVPGWETSGRA